MYTTFTASAFASGSVDGMILVWATSSLQPIRRLHPVSDGESDIKRFPHSVQSLMCLQEVTCNYLPHIFLHLFILIVFPMLKV